MSYGFQVQRKWTIRQTIYTIFQRLRALHETNEMKLRIHILNNLRVSMKYKRFMNVIKWILLNIQNIISVNFTYHSLRWLIIISFKKTWQLIPRTLIIKHIPMTRNIEKIISIANYVVLIANRYGEIFLSHTFNKHIHT